MSPLWEVQDVDSENGGMNISVSHEQNKNRQQNRLNWIQQVTPSSYSLSQSIGLHKEENATFILTIQQPDCIPEDDGCTIFLPAWPR